MRAVFVAALCLSVAGCAGSTAPRHVGAVYIPSTDPYDLGNKYYYKNDFRTAVEYYEKALDREKKDRWLRYEFFIVLVDNLGKSYAAIGQWNKAKVTFEYGSSIYPRYPGFYGNLACVNARQNDIDAVVSNLEKWHQYKHNQLPGEHPIDPKQVSCFKDILGDPRIKWFLNTHGL